MLRGRYGDTSGRPFISGGLFIPSIGVRGTISFLIDTGADGTVLMPTDAKRLGVDYFALPEKRESFGIGGKSVDGMVDAFITLIEPGVIAYAWEITLRVMGVNSGTVQAPSLLGRDILRHMRFIYEPSANILEADVRFCHAQKDLTVPEPPAP